jgi:hypothetical protein
MGVLPVHRKKEKPEEWKKKGGMGEARAAAPGAEPLAAGGGEAHPAGAMPIPQPLFRKKKRGGAGGEGAEGCPWEGRRRRAAGPHVAGRQARPPDGGDTPCWSR